MEPDRPLVGAPSGDTPPKRVFGYFLHEQKVPRRRLAMASMGSKGDTLAVAVKRNGVGKEDTKNAVLETGQGRQPSLLRQPNLNFS